LQENKIPEIPLDRDFIFLSPSAFTTVIINSPRRVESLNDADNPEIFLRKSALALLCSKMSIMNKPWLTCQGLLVITHQCLSMSVTAVVGRMY
jgi:hypothetical protein